MRRLVNAPESNAGAEGEKCQWLVRKARGAVCCDKSVTQLRRLVHVQQKNTIVRTASIVVHQSKLQVEVNLVACSAVHLHDRTSVLPTAGLCFAQLERKQHHTPSRRGCRPTRRLRARQHRTPAMRGRPHRRRTRSPPPRCAKTSELGRSTMATEESAGA